MRRLLFLSPLIIATIVCAYLVKAYIDNNSKVSPASAKSVFKIAMDTSGYSSYEKNSRRTLQKFSLSVRSGVTRIREEMEFISNQREKIMDRLQQQQQILENQKQNAQAIKDMIAQNNSLGVRADLLHVKDIVDIIDRQSRILEDSQRRMAEMSQHIQEGTTKINSSFAFADAAGSNSQQITNDRMDMLRRQSSEAMANHAQFMENAKQQADLAHEQTKGIAQQLMDTHELMSSMRGPSSTELKEHVKQLLDKEHEMMEKIRDGRDRIDQQRQELKRRMEAYQERMRDIMESNETKVADARQKAEDINRQNKEKVADQMQRLREQRMNRQQ